MEKAKSGDKETITTLSNEYDIKPTFREKVSEAA